eukprot:4209625-Lingulodinium_polyedra.AAC.1
MPRRSGSASRPVPAQYLTMPSCLRSKTLRQRGRRRAGAMAAQAARDSAARAVAPQGSACARGSTCCHSSWR